MNGLTEEQEATIRGLDPAVVTEMAKHMGVPTQIAAEQLKQLGQAMLEQELDASGPVQAANRAARRARERAGRKRARG